MTAAVIVVTIPIIALAALILLLNVYAPSALDVQVVKYVVQVIPRVTGRVIEVPVEPNRLVRKGDVLFRIDPRPFQYEVDRLEAMLASTAADVGATREETESGGRADRRVAESRHVGRELDRGNPSPAEAGRAPCRPDRRTRGCGRGRPVRGRTLADRSRAAAGGPGRAAAATVGRRAGGHRQPGTRRRPAREARRPIGRRAGRRRAGAGAAGGRAVEAQRDGRLCAGRRLGDQHAVAARLDGVATAAEPGHELRGTGPDHPRPVRAERAAPGRTRQ